MYPQREKPSQRVSRASERLRPSWSLCRKYDPAAPPVGRARRVRLLCRQTSAGSFHPVALRSRQSDEPERPRWHAASPTDGQAAAEVADETAAQHWVRQERRPCPHRPSHHHLAYPCWSARHAAKSAASAWSRAVVAVVVDEPRLPQPLHSRDRKSSCSMHRCLPR